MPPEVLQNNKTELAPSIDIWSLGCILYEILVGARIFTTSDREELIDQICNFQLPKIPDYISEEATLLIKSMLEFSPKDRIDSSEILTSSWFNKRAESIKIPTLNESSSEVLLLPNKQKSLRFSLDCDKKKKHTQKNFKQKKTLELEHNYMNTCPDNDNREKHETLEIRESSEDLNEITDSEEENSEDIDFKEDYDFQDPKMKFFNTAKNSEVNKRKICFNNLDYASPGEFNKIGEFNCINDFNQKLGNFKNLQNMHSPVFKKKNDPSDYNNEYENKASPAFNLTQSKLLLKTPDESYFPLSTSYKFFSPTSKAKTLNFSKYFTKTSKGKVYDFNL